MLPDVSKNFTMSSASRRILRSPNDLSGSIWIDWRLRYGIQLHDFWLIAT